MCDFFSKYNTTSIFNQPEIKNFQNKEYDKFKKDKEADKKLQKSKKTENISELAEGYQKAECGICFIPHTKTKACDK